MTVERSEGPYVEPLRVGARTSPLARTQADWVADRLAGLGVASQFVGVVTTGDVDPRELTQIGGTGVFVGAVRAGLLDGSVDIAVHSLKDLPTGPEPGLRIAAVPTREDVRDVLVGATLADLVGRGRPVRIGTGSPRRAVQLRAWGAGAGVEVEVVPVRGNVDTRIAHVLDARLDATVLAAAGLRRLGRLRTGTGAEPDATTSGPVQISSADMVLAGELLEPEVMLPAAGQGALAVEVASAGTHPRLVEVNRLDDPASRARVLAERTFLATLEAGCLAPVGVLARIVDRSDHSADSQPQDLTLDAVIGRTVTSEVADPVPSELMRVRHHGPVSEAGEVGRYLADRVLSELGRDLR